MIRFKSIEMKSIVEFEMNKKRGREGITNGEVRTSCIKKLLPNNHCLAWLYSL